MRILLTNDDGVFAPGLRALYRELVRIADVTVVAPASEESGVGHGITLRQPLVVTEVHQEGRSIGFAVDGKPADCVKLGVVELLGERPDLVVSGINGGANAGIDVLYSGTVAAAVEGAFFGITSIAVSLQLPSDEQFPRAAQLARTVVEGLIASQPEKGSLYNVNIPRLDRGDPKGIRVAHQALDVYRERYEARTDPLGRPYYWLLPAGIEPRPGARNDLLELADGYVTLTPLHFDMTNRRELESLRSRPWDVSWPPPPESDLTETE